MINMIIEQSIWRDLILSVGTHKGKRPLSPVEVGFWIEKAIISGMNLTQIADKILLDKSMVDRFTKLSQLAPGLRHLIDWGRSTSSAISFSSGVILSSLGSEIQENLALSILEHNLSKNEINQIKQIKNRSEKDLNACVKEVLKLRPKIIRNYLFLGVIREEKVRKKLEAFTQIQRDKLMTDSLDPLMRISGDWSSRLGSRQFVLVGGKELSDKLNSLSPDYESCINKSISENLNNARQSNH